MWVDLSKKEGGNDLLIVMLSSYQAISIEYVKDMKKKVNLYSSSWQIKSPLSFLLTEINRIPSFFNTQLLFWNISEWKDCVENAETYFFWLKWFFVVNKKGKYWKKVQFGTGTESQVLILALISVQKWTVPNPKLNRRQPQFLGLIYTNGYCND